MGIRSDVSASRRVLVIAPHADDEVIGCGGTIARATRQGDEVVLIVMAAGGIQHRHTGVVTTTAERSAEMWEASRHLGILDSRILFPDFDMRLESLPMLRIVTALDEILETGPFDECYIPTPGHNLDHRLTHDACLAALRPGGPQRVAMVALYENTYPGWSSRSGAGGRLYVDIASTLDAKVAALGAYKSQVREYPHPTSVEAVRRLAAMRGLECGREAAERFQILSMIRV